MILIRRRAFSVNNHLYTVLFWAMSGIYVFSVFSLFFGVTHALSKVVIDLPLQILFAHLHIRYVIPYLVLNKNYPRFILSTFLMIVVMVLAGRLLLYGYTMLFLPHLMAGWDLFSAKQLAAAPFDYLTIPFLYITAHTLHSSYKISLQNERLHHARKTAELNFLKAQINPHFLFNTLNSLYGLCFTGAQNAATSILHLSKIMEYMVFESNKAVTELKKEIEYLENYMTLEQLRYGDRLQLSVNIHVPAPNLHLPIAPLLLLPFLENAFKHGASRQDGEVWIMLSLTVVSNKLKYTVTNNCGSRDQAPEKEYESGLRIMINRLELIYPGKYQVHTMREDETFTSVLEINY